MVLSLYSYIQAVALHGVRHSLCGGAMTGTVGL